MAKLSIAKKVYLHQNGVETSHAGPDSIGVRFDFVGDNGETVMESRNIMFADIPDTLRPAFLANGIAQKFGDCYAGAAQKAEKAEMDPADWAIEQFDALFERIVAGDWIASGESAGPRDNMLVDAIVAALEENGETVNAERRQSILHKLSPAGRDLTDEQREALKTARKRALENPLFKAHYERLQAERATARAAKAAEKAQGVSLDSLQDF